MDYQDYQDPTQLSRMAIGRGKSLKLINTSSPSPNDGYASPCLNSHSTHMCVSSSLVHPMPCTSSSLSYTCITLHGFDLCKAANEANRKLGMNSRGFKNKTRAVMLPLYKARVRSDLDYCIQAWRPHLRKNIDRLERVQRRATKMIEGLEGCDYLERLWV